MILSLLCVLYTLEDSEDLLQLLAEVLNEGDSLLTPLDNVSFISLLAIGLHSADKCFALSDAEKTRSFASRKALV